MDDVLESAYEARMEQRQLIYVRLSVQNTKTVQSRKLSQNV